MFHKTSFKSLRSSVPDRFSNAGIFVAAFKVVPVFQGCEFVIIQAENLVFGDIAKFHHQNEAVW